MKLIINENNYDIKYGYEVTVKSRLLKKLIEVENVDENDGVNKVDTMLAFLPELVLIGLQKNHKEEFGYNVMTEEGKEEALDKVFAMLDSYFDNDEADFMNLYSDLFAELMENGFLAKMFRQMTTTAKKSKKN